MPVSRRFTRFLPSTTISSAQPPPGGTPATSSELAHPSSCRPLSIAISPPHRQSLSLLTSFHSMDAPSTAPGVPGGSSFVVLCVAIVGILATALLLLSYYLFLTRCGLLFFWRADHGDDVAHHHHHVRIVVQEQPPPAARRGMEAAAIRRIPTFRYQKSSSDKLGKAAPQEDCAVCLAEFRDGERLRQLPPCLHAFHIDCIDAWLQATANCPLCRATVADAPGRADIAIDISSSQSPAAAADSEDVPAPPSGEEEMSQQQPVTTTRRSLSMDSSTDKRFYLALQRMLQRQQHQQPSEDDAKSSGESSSSSTPPPRRLRRSFFSFSHSRSAAILPL